MSELKIEVTHRCNLRCVHCSSVSDPPVDDMSLDCFKDIVRQAWNMSICRLVISGGEPLLWQPLLSGIEYATALNKAVRVTLYTSGHPVLDKSMVASLQSAGLSRVIFGVHGVEARTHDMITKVAGSCDTTTNSLQMIVSHKIPCEVHFVPLKWNYREAEGVVRVYEAFGVERVSFLRFIPHGRGAFNQENLILSREETEALAMHITRTKQTATQLFGAEVRVGSPFNILGLGDGSFCKAGLLRATIGPDGNVYPCDGFKHITPAMVGCQDPSPNIHEHPLMWCIEQSEYFRQARLLSIGNADNPGPTCTGCHRLSSCQGGCIAQKILAGLRATDPDPGCLAERTQAK
jgi:radical SAM protein with 4Fe4S-binding SPASM domain